MNQYNNNGDRIGYWEIYYSDGELINKVLHI